MKPIILFFLFICFQLNAQIKYRTIFFEDFTTNEGLWPIGESALYNSQIENGYYSIEHKVPDAHCFNDEIIANFTDDFTLKSTLKISNIPVGMVWGMTTNDYLNHFIIKEDSFRVYSIVNSKFNLIQKYTFSKEIKQNKDNTLTVTKKNNIITFLINNKPVFKTEDIISKGRLIGFYVKGIGSFKVNDIEVLQNKDKINLNPAFELNNLPEPLSKINTNQTELMPIVSPSNNELYYVGRNYTTNVGDINNGDIYVSEYIDNDWQKGKRLAAAINNIYDNQVCGISADGNTLLLGNAYTETNQCISGVSISHKQKTGWSFPENLVINEYTNIDKACTFSLSTDQTILLLSIQTTTQNSGKKDIYVSFKKDSVWTKPQNLGTIINTEFEEISPFLASDNKTLYFSSEGHPGYGSTDIFVSTRLDATWANWSKPINLGPKINSKKWDAYFNIPLKGDYAYFVRYNFESKSDIYKIKLKDLSIDTIKQKTTKELVINQTDTLVQLNNVFFYKSSDRLISTSFKELNTLSKILNDNPLLIIEIRGHTDNQGNPKLNQLLSEDRAKAIMNYLINAGISKNRLFAKGFGSTKPLALNDTEENKQLNRRVEFYIISK